MKKIIIYLIVFVLGIVFNSAVFGATVTCYEKVGDFVCNVMIDGKPIKEIDGIAVIPFESEYKLLLKNNNNRKAVAKITIDGSPISTFWGLVINANSEETLERYITESLDKGKKFKFVPLNHPNVDDPSRKENGLIRIEFRLAKKQGYIIWDGSEGFFIDEQFEFDVDTSSLTDDVLTDSDIDISNTCVNCSSSAEPGATIGGSESTQKFHKVDIEFEDKTWVVEIRLKGIKK